MIHFTLSAPTPSLNAASRASGHWRTRHKTKRRLQSLWCNEIALAVRYRVCLARARVTIHRHSSGTLDVDNLYGGVKPLLDVLKPPGKSNPFGLGMIADDRPDVCELVVHQVKCRQADARTEVLIEAL